MNMSASIRVKRSRKWAGREATISHDHKITISLEEQRKQAWDHHTSDHWRAKRIKSHLKKKMREREEEPSAVLVSLEVSWSVGRGTRSGSLPPPQSPPVYLRVLQRCIVGLGGAPHCSRSLGRLLRHCFLMSIRKLELNLLCRSKSKNKLRRRHEEKERVSQRREKQKGSTFYAAILLIRKAPGWPNISPPSFHLQRTATKWDKGHLMTWRWQRTFSRNE